MKIKIFLTILVIFCFGIAFVLGRFSTSSETEEFSILPTPVPTPLSKYSIESLRQASVVPAKITVLESVKKEKEFESFLFVMEFDPTLTEGAQKKVSGLINIPLSEGQHPVAVMLRGYVDPSIYASGVGTKNASEYLAKKNYITIAPDFFGYGASDTESGNIFETRFQTYTTFLTLLTSIVSPEFSNVSRELWDGRNIFIWAHSNGGQIALTGLTVNGEAIPTALWAPVTKPFPYSILYYTDESGDGGKFIRKELSRFENLYDVEKYSFTNYLDKLNAPLLIEQGSGDLAVPVEWTRSIVGKLKKLQKDVTYHEYARADHNLRPAWDTAMQNTFVFFEKWRKQ